MANTQSWQMHYLWRQMYREWLLHLRQPQLILNSSLFYLMISIFLPLTLPLDQDLLRIASGGLIWVAMLLAMLLATLLFFQQDYDDGIIEQWLLAGYPLHRIIAVKIYMQWLLNIIPMLFFCPLLALLFSFKVYEMLILMLGLIIGSPTIFFLCALAAAFSTGLTQKGVLMALIILPLAIPSMIFGSSLLMTAMQGFPISEYLAILLAISLLAVAFLPMAIAAVIRITLVN